VLRVACAHDCGLMINPDAVRAQVEGCILQTLSRTLFEEVTFDRSRVTSTDWGSYPILTFPEVPQLDIELIDRRHERPLGAGEAATRGRPSGCRQRRGRRDRREIAHGAVHSGAREGGLDGASDLSVRPRRNAGDGRPATASRRQPAQ